MRLLENPPKVVQLQNYVKSGIMVVRGRYMTHFDRRDLLESKKLVWDRFRNMPALQMSICEFLGFFRGISRIAQNPQKPSASTLDLEIFFQKLISCCEFCLCENTVLKLHFGIFTSGGTQFYICELDF